MLVFFNEYKKLIEVAVLAVALYFGYMWIGDSAVNKYKTEQAALQAKSEKLQQEKYDKLSADYTTLQAQRTENTNTITHEVQTIVKQPIYQTSCVDAAGVDAANRAIAGKP